MDGNNWRTAQGQVQIPGQVNGSEAGNAAGMEGVDWRTRVQPDSRQRIVNKIMETLKRHLPLPGPEGLKELKKMAVRFEEKIYVQATSQMDYLRKISFKMLRIETIFQNPMANSLQSSAASTNKNSQETASQNMQSQIQNQIQQQPVPMISNQSQDIIENDIASVGEMRVVKMDGNNWRTAQGQVQIPNQVNGSEAGNAAGMEGVDWRTWVQPDSRQRIVNKIMETLKRHIPLPGPEGLQELKKIAVRFEERIYAAATSQTDYLRKISFKMLTMETRCQNPMANSLPSSAASTNKNSQETASQNMQSQIQNQIQQQPVPMISNQSQVRQQLISQNIQNNIASVGEMPWYQLASYIHQSVKMDGNNWRTAQGQVQIPGQVNGSEAGNAVGMEGVDWRTQLQPDSRQTIVNKIMETLKRHLPLPGPEVLQELKKIAVWFEEKIYAQATSQTDYLRKISLKMLAMEIRFSNPMANSLQSSAASTNKNSQETASQNMQSQIQNQIQQQPVPMISNQSQVRQQLTSQDIIENNIASVVEMVSELSID